MIRYFYLSSGISCRFKATRHAIRRCNTVGKSGRFVLSSKKSRILGPRREVFDLPFYVETQGEFYLVSGTTKLPKRKYLCAWTSAAGFSSGFSKYDIPVNVSRLSTIRGHDSSRRWCQIKPLLAYRVVWFEKNSLISKRLAICSHPYSIIIIFNWNF